MRLQTAALACAALALLATACGQTGPLYMPDEPPPAATPDAGTGVPGTENGGPEPVN